MESLHYYVASRFFIVLHLFIFTASVSPSIMATNTNVNPNNLSTDVTMESLVAEIRNLKAELTALQTQESFQNLSLDERGRERSHSSHPNRGLTTLKYSIFWTYLAKTFWLGGPSSKSSLITIDGPTQRPSNWCMPTWRAPLWSPSWTSPSPDGRPWGKFWMSIKTDFFQRAIPSSYGPSSPA